jgi:antitoxin component YwqK of YwqJK toxin-antitoxin module
MKRLTFVFVIILSISVNAQDVVKKDNLKSVNGLLYSLNDNKPFTGKLATYFPNGNIESYRYIKDGAKTGRVESFFDSGIKRVVTYEDEHFVNYGEVIIWNEDTTVAFAGEWVSGQLYQKGDKQPFTGKIIVKFVNGIKNEESDFRNGQWNGKQILRNREGKVVSECIFENNKIISCK